ncbi:hypothetical protein GSI_04854 [Ganoderma sinense ZZ0214-1]|uniref:F-box domain-containing protein n=1 Tax=Ganoderma sinense ZZ0214-1 TaxID=1077348 RepID=A0A2G8SG50_9APHY|nr:hypothetical protein GSI_04854 [Ganoderma sinense ZZ0214-1]
MASFHASGASLLPRLQRLRLPNLDAETTAYTIPLLSPTVQSVTVSFDVGTDPDDPKIKDRDNFEMFLSALRVASPSLQELVVFHQYRTFHMGKKHIDSMSGFAHLQHFSSTITLNPAAWSQLGSIRPLRHLDICIRSLDSPSNLEPGSHLENTDANLTPESYTLSLPNLHSAKVKGPLDTLAIFVDNLESPALRSLTFNVYSSPTPSVLGEFLDLAKEKLPRALRKLVLQSFSLRQPQSGPYEQAEPVDLQPLLPPLASLTGLEDLSLDFFEIPMYVSDDAIRTLADGLPTLVSLALRYKPPCYHRTAADPDAQAPDKRPTIGALVALANGCPHLARLHIVDVDVDAETPHDCVVPALDHPLRELEITSFSSRTRGRVFGFAEKLHRIFPHLGDVRAHGACSGWNVAKEYLEYLQTV